MSQRKVTRHQSKGFGNSSRAQLSNRFNSFKPRPSSASTPRQPWIETEDLSDNENVRTGDPQEEFSNPCQSSEDSVQDYTFINESDLEKENENLRDREAASNSDFMSAFRELEKENDKLRESLNLGNRASLAPYNGFSGPNDSSNALLHSISGMLNSSHFKIPASTVGHCKPQDGIALQITDWEVWRKRFESWLNINGVEDPEKRQEFFNIMSGDQLYLALQTAPTVKGSTASHYAQTVEQLNGVFRARANDFALRTEFRSTTQEKGEKNVDYLSRLMKSALRIWERFDPAIDSEILLCVAVNGLPKLQEFTMKLCNEAAEKQNYESLVNQARVLDNLSGLSSSKAPVCTILAVENKSLYTSRNSYTGSPSASTSTGRLGHSTRPYSRQGNDSHRDSGNTSRECYRCGSTKHLAHNCDLSQSTCEFCGIKGHIEGVCRKKRRPQPLFLKELKKQRLSNIDDFSAEPKPVDKV